MECFRCVACSKQLLRGEEFALRDNGLFCKADHIILEKAREHYSAENLPVSMNTGKLIAVFSFIVLSIYTCAFVRSRFAGVRDALCAKHQLVSVRSKFIRAVDVPYRGHISAFIRMQA